MFLTILVFHALGPLIKFVIDLTKICKQSSKTSFAHYVRCNLALFMHLRYEWMQISFLHFWLLGRCSSDGFWFYLFGTLQCKHFSLLNLLRLECKHFRLLFLLLFWSWRIFRISFFNKQRRHRFWYMHFLSRILSFLVTLTVRIVRALFTFFGRSLN